MGVLRTLLYVGGGAALIVLLAWVVGRWRARRRDRAGSARTREIGRKHPEERQPERESPTDLEERP
ncbi:MAG: hypothetical protein PVJ27_07675 [Candidatus Brocadiaceae bacterium]|jgi:hypothetical protein